VEAAVQAQRLTAPPTAVTDTSSYFPVVSDAWAGKRKQAGALV